MRLGRFAIVCSAMALFVYPNGGHTGRTPGMDSSAVATLIIDWLTGKLSR